MGPGYPHTRRCASSLLNIDLRPVSLATARNAQATQLS